MRTNAFLTLALLLASSSAFAQPATPLGAAFLTGARACVNILAGKLSLNPPSLTQNKAGLVLADPEAPDEIVPFRDLSPSARQFAPVDALNGAVMVAYDPSQKLCRVAVLHVKDVSPVTATVGSLGKDWTMVSNDPLANFSVYKGTILGSPKLTIRTRRPKSGFGAATYMLTLVAQ